MDPVTAALSLETGTGFGPLPKGYLGDGLYVFFDGYSIFLAAPRQHGLHWVSLEPDMVDELIAFRVQAREVIRDALKKQNEHDPTP